MEGRTVLVTAADSAVGVELTRELCRRGARVIMAVKVSCAFCTYCRMALSTVLHKL